jgi:hypothetical protein
MEEKNQYQSKIFKELVRRNSINFHSPDYQAEVFQGIDFDSLKLKKIVKEFSKEVGGQNDI